MLLRVYRALMDEYDPTSAMAAVGAEWVHDVRGESMLTHELFCDAVFEMYVPRDDRH